MDIEKYWESTINQNEDEMKKYFHNNAKIKWNNTKEIFTVEEFIKFNCEYPGEWDGIIKRINKLKTDFYDEMEEFVVVVNVFSKDKKISHHVTSFMKIFKDKILEIDEYWGEDGEIPEWRKV